MKFIAIVHRNADFSPEEFAPLLEAESRQALTLLKEEKLREIYSRADGKGAILVLEADDEAQARAYVETLPLMQKGMLRAEIHGAKPYRAFVAGL